MTLTRWKVMAGALGVSLGGLAALADSPKPPVPVPAPNVIELPPIPAATTPPAVEPPPVLVPAPTVAAAPPAEVAPAPKVIELSVPAIVVSTPKADAPSLVIPAAAFEVVDDAPPKGIVEGLITIPQAVWKGLADVPPGYAGGIEAVGGGPGVAVAARLVPNHQEAAVIGLLTVGCHRHCYSTVLRSRP